MNTNTIVYFIDYPLDLLGGAQLSTSSICEYIVDNEMNMIPTVVCPRLMNDTYYPYRIITYENQGLGFVDIFHKLYTYRKIIKKEKPQLIHAQMPLSAILLGLLKTFGLIKNSKLIFTDRALYSGYSKKSRLLFSFVVRSFDKLICTTELNLRMWLSHFPNIRSTDVVYNSVSQDFIKGIDNSFNRVPEDVLTIGFAGRVTDVKDWPLSVSICEELKNNNIKTNIKCVMSAYTEAEKNTMFEYIEEMAEIIGSENFEVFIDLPQDEMASFYEKLDVFILTSKFESFGKTAIEAMRCNCSVIATNVGGLPEVLGKRENLYDSDNIGKCIDKIKQYVADRNELERDKQFFYTRFMERFDQEKCYKKTIDIYNSLLTQ